MKASDRTPIGQSLDARYHDLGCRDAARIPRRYEAAGAAVRLYAPGNKPSANSAGYWYIVGFLECAQPAILDAVEFKPSERSMAAKLRHLIKVIQSAGYAVTLYSDDGEPL